ncbi:MAG: thiamine phosphate synthase [Burkholderiaceae bacterium]|nr:MAG: thiamine phosphate synthase [Burkholderiaceae bacterium]
MQIKSWQRGLYLVTPNWDDTKQLLRSTEQALQAGVALLQYRHKTADPELRLQQASALQALCRRYQTAFVINDHVELAVQLGADGVHVGGTDVSVAQARELLGNHKIVGASCYGDLSLARAAQAQGASYVAFGGFYPSVVKKYPVTTPLDLVREARVVIPLPIVVIGGMTVELARPLVERGADLVAAISSVYNHADTNDAARQFVSLFK